MTSIRWTMGKVQGFLPRLRALWYSVVLRYDSELCQDCGRRYNGFCWYAEDALWGQVVQAWQRDADGRWYHLNDAGEVRYEGEVRVIGLLCPACFDRRARRHGLWLNWEPRIDHPYDRSRPSSVTP